MDLSYSRYEVRIGNSEPVFEISANKDGSFYCEFTDDTAVDFTPDTLCEVVEMRDILTVRNLSDILKLFKSKGYYTACGESEYTALLQEFSEDPIAAMDYDDCCLDELVLVLQNTLFGKLSKPKKMTLSEIYKKYD